MSESRCYFFPSYAQKVGGTVPPLQKVTPMALSLDPWHYMKWVRGKPKLNIKNTVPNTARHIIPSALIIYDTATVIIIVSRWWNLAAYCMLTALYCWLCSAVGLLPTWFQTDNSCNGNTVKWQSVDSFAVVYYGKMFRFICTRKVTSYRWNIKQVSKVLCKKSRHWM